MKKLSITEFRRICLEMAPAIFIFDTGNQTGSVNTDIAIVSRYYDVVVMLNPNRICMINDSGTLCFDGVRYILSYDDNESVATAFTIVCRDAKYAIVVEAKKIHANYKISLTSKSTYVTLSL